MVKRKMKKKTRRSKQKGVSIIGLAETYLLANAVTMAMFKNNPINFIAGGFGPAARNSDVITLRELIQPKDRFTITSARKGPLDYIKLNLSRRDGGAFGAVVQLVTIPIMFRVGKKLAAAPIRRTNKLLGDVGIANTVKV